MFELIELPYGSKDLEPVISAQTLSFHHGKHLQAYVDNLNKLLPGSGLLQQGAESERLEVGPEIDGIGTHEWNNMGLLAHIFGIEG